MELELILRNKKYWIISGLIVLASVIAFGKIDITEIVNSVTYDQFLESIYSSKYSGISIFEESNQMLELLKAAYLNVVDVKIVNGNFAFARKWMLFDAGIFMMFIYSVMFTWFFIETDRSKTPILFATPGGRTGLAVQRIISIYICAMLFLVFWMGGLILTSQIQCGIGQDFRVSVQSIHELQECVLPISFLQFMLIDLSLTAIGIAITIQIMWLIKRIFASNIVATSLIIVIYLIEYGLFTLSEQSPFILSKYINLWNLLIPHNILKSYRILTVGNYYCGSIELYVYFLLMLWGITTALVIWVENLRAGRLAIKLVKPNFLAAMQYRILSRIRFFQLELYKIFIEQKAAFFLIISVFLICTMVDFNSPSYYGVDDWKRAIYQEYSGPDLERVERFVDDKKAEIARFDEEYMLAQERYQKNEISKDEYEKYGIRGSLIEIDRTGTADIEEQLLSLKMSQKKGVDVYFLDNLPYQKLWKSSTRYVTKNDEKRRMYGILSLIIVIMLVSPVFSYERDMKLEKLIMPLARGRKYLFNLRHVILIAICICSWALIYGIELIEINKIYKLTFLEAPVQSLVFLENFPFKMKIGGFLLLVELFHLAALYVFAWITVLLCCKLGSIKGMLLAMLLLITPEVLNTYSSIRLHWLSSIQIIVATERICKFNIWLYMISFAVCAIIAAVCFTRIKRKNL